MLIESSEITEMHFDRFTKQARGVVLLTTATQSVTLFCRATVPGWAEATQVLLDDALRQLRRMPEFRRNPDSIRLTTVRAPIENVLAA